MSLDPARPLEVIDGDLVRSYLDGRSPAFDVLYRRHYPRLTAMCRRITGDPMLAEDLAQETLVRALTHLDGFDAGRPMWPWLKTIATRLAIDHARSRDRETLAEVPDEPDPGRHDTVGCEERLALLQALEAVPRRQRVALMLRYLDDWSPAEVGGFLGLSRPAFEQLLFRARGTLRAEYRRLSDGALGLILVPFGWLRRLARAANTRMHSAGLAGDGATSVTAMQFASGLLALAVGLSVPASAASPAARLAAPRIPPAVSAPMQVAAPGGDATGQATLPPATSAPRAADPGGLVGEVTDPNADVDEPEDVRIDAIVSSPGFKRDGTLFASGHRSCRVPPCAPVLFRSTDGGVTWSRLLAWGYSGSALLLPPGFGPSDHRIFSMGPEGLQMSLDEGAAFVPAIYGGASYAVGSAAISPAFDAGDQTILIGAQTLLQYEAQQGTVRPAAYSALPGPLEPAFAPAYPVDPRIVLGAVQPDTQAGALVSTVFICSATVCSSRSLAGEQEVPRIRLDGHFGRSGVAYAFTSRSVFASADGARSFVRLPSGWPASEAIRDLSITDSGLILSTGGFGEEPGGVYRSADGITWSRVGWSGFARGGGAIGAADDRIVVALGSAGLGCSVDGGLTWASRCPAASPR